MEWQPIETAPKDGNDVILHCVVTDDQGTASHSTMVGHWIGERFAVVTMLQMGDFTTCTVLEMPWTHWMPLPEPPQ